MGIPAKSVLVALIALSLPRLALAQGASLEVARQAGIFCPALGARVAVVLGNLTGTAQTIPAGTRMSMIFSAPVTSTPVNPSGISLSFSANTVTAVFTANVTVESNFSLFFNPVSLNLQSVPNGTPITVAVTTNPLNAVTFGTQSSTVILGLADAGACQPAPRSTFTIEDLTSGCPTAQEVAVFRATMDLRLESDPSAGTLVCRAADGSADLTRLEERTFQAFRLMQFLPFDAPLPWTPKPLYDWLTGAIRGIRYRSDISLSFCCDPGGYINIQTNNLGDLAFPTDPEWVISLADLLVHESRHNEGLPHTCGSGDQTISELGAWGAVFYYNEWAAFHTGDFLKSRKVGLPAFYRAWAWDASQRVLDYRICDHAGGVAVSPLVLDFGAQTVGVASAPRTMAVTQTEGGPVTISGVSLNGTNAADFSVTSPPCVGATLPPSCAVVVRFTPLAAGQRTAQLTVIFSDLVEPVSATVQGVGVSVSLAESLALGPHKARPISLAIVPSRLRLRYASLPRGDLETPRVRRAAHQAGLLYYP